MGSKPNKALEACSPVTGSEIVLVHVFTLAYDFIVPLFLLKQMQH